MARDIKEIYNEMISEKESNAMLNSLQPNISSYQALLSDLTTQSKVAVWRLIFFVSAVSIWTLEKLFDEHKEWINERATELFTGSLQWYVQKALEFQLGYSLQFNGKQFEYATIDVNARIVKVAAATEVGTSVLIKVAKLDSNNLPTKLDPNEMEVFEKYIAKVKYAGLQVLAVSRSADLMKVFYHIHVDPLVINTNGELISNPSVKPIENVINKFIQNLPFNGEFKTTSLTDEIQKIEGVINPVLDSCEVRYGTQSFQPAGDAYIANAGYLKIDSGFPLTNTITYLS